MSDEGSAADAGDRRQQLPVLLLHGLGADQRAFQRFERLLPADHDVRAIDLLGHGAAPKPHSGYSLDDHADYIASQLGGRRSVLVGHSYGAAAAVATAARHPSLVAAIVLLDPVLVRDGVQGAGTVRMIDARTRGEMAPVVDDLFASESAALRRWIIETWEQMAVGVVSEIDTNWPRFAADVQCPVTVIHGDHELGGGGPEPAAEFRAATVVRIVGAGHYLHASHARETAAAVAAAISATEAAAT